MNKTHLAQINVARAQAPMDPGLISGFVNRWDEINRLADHATEFVWGFQTDDGDATSLKVFDDPSLLINMSVWTNGDARIQLAPCRLNSRQRRAV